MKKIGKYFIHHKTDLYLSVIVILNLNVSIYIQFKESIKDFEEFRPSLPEQFEEYIRLIISKVLEKSDAARSSVGNLFSHALKEKKIDLKIFTSALKNIVELVEEYVIDIPKIAVYLSQIIGIFIFFIQLEF